MLVIIVGIYTKGGMKRGGTSTTAHSASCWRRNWRITGGVPIQVNANLSVAAASQTVTVEAGAPEILENTPTTQTTIDVRTLKLPNESTNSGLSSIIANASPGVAADSNGFFHPLGDTNTQIPRSASMGSLFQTSKAASLLINFRPMPNSRWK